MKVLLLSAYNTHSHNYWCNLLINNLPRYQWTLLTLPPRKFSWRIRGNALSWMAEKNEELNKEYDTIIATSMVDFATLIGLYPHLGKSNKIIYFHENQFEYPLSDNKGHSNVESMMVNLYGALAADKVVFNSKYNRSSFLDGAKHLLKKINDHSPLSIIDQIEIKSILLPVPICTKTVGNKPKIKNSIIWNHRWEYDKNPEEFYQALKILKGKDISFTLIMMGIEFKNSPPAFEKIKRDFKDQILCWGHQPRDEYVKWLTLGELIISTAIHEFQGLAVMEGVQYGAIPIVPNRLSYPEWFSNDFLYQESASDLAKAIELMFKSEKTPPNINKLTWESLKARYIEIINPL